MKEYNYVSDKMSIGTCYYPEHWDKSLWREDLERMLANGIETIRVAEFAWNKTEIREGEFNFSFWDEFLDLCLEMGMKVIFCTPTATPPAWASTNYPEILNCDRQRHPYYHGNRRHYNYNSPKYRELSAIITQKLGEHYGQHPAIIGWQLDNEFNCEHGEFYSAADDEAFRVYLRKIYGTLEALNKAWGTAFWNQDYSDWKQVKTPDTANCNPHRELDYCRFLSASTISYAAMQTAILRPYLPKNVWITTNGIFGNVDYQAMKGQAIDFITYDSYPNFANELGHGPAAKGDLKDRKWSQNLSEVRAISPIFGIMEQQSGANGWNTRMSASNPKPGQMTLWTLQSVAHGADFVSYFRWRTACFGTEIYWHGILDYDNRDNRKLAEAKHCSEVMKKLTPYVKGAHYQAKLAVLKDYDNVFDSQIDVVHGDVEGPSKKGIYSAAQKLHVPMDYLYLSPEVNADDLLKYEVLIYPHALIMTEERAALLEEYVRQGGTLVVGCRTGYKNMQGHCVMMPKPGLLAPLCGCDVVEATYCNPHDEEVKAQWGEDTVPMKVYNDVLQLTEGNSVVEGTYTGSYYAGQPAIVSHPVGDGVVYSVGSVFSEDLTRVLLKKVGLAETFGEVINAPEEVEIAVREGKDYRNFFALNYMEEPETITVSRPLLDVCTGETVCGALELKPFEVRVLSEKIN